MDDSPTDDSHQNGIGDVSYSDSPPIDDGFGIVGLIRALAVDGERWKVFEYHSPVTGLRRLAVERAGVVTEVGTLPPAWRELSDVELLSLLSGN